MYKRILVPVDGSTFAEQLLAPAAQVARATHSELAVLRVVDNAEDHGAAARYAQELAAPHGAQAICLPTQLEGVAATIRDEARRVPGTLVAMCSHGRSGAMQALFGSVALEVLRALGEPVVVFRPTADGPPALTKVGRVVLPLDGSTLSESIMPQAAELAKWLGGRIIVVSVIEPSIRLGADVPASDVQESGYVRARARELHERYGVEASWEVLHGKPQEAIPSFVRSLGDAMLAMCTHGHSGLRAVMAGSVTAHCMREAQVPVLVRVP